MNTECFAPLIDPIQTIGRPDTGANILFSPLHNFLNDMRIGHVRARHAHHVQLPRRHSMARGRNIRNTRGVKGRQSNLGPHASREIQMRRAFHTLDGNDIGQGGIGMNATANDVDKINLTRCGKAF